MCVSNPLTSKFAHWSRSEGRCRITIPHPSTRSLPWAEKYGLYEEFLQHVFGNLRNEEHYRPRVEPDSFRRYLPVLKAVESGRELFLVTSIAQYENASVVVLDVESRPPTESADPAVATVHEGQGFPHRHRFWTLDAGEGYACRDWAMADRAIGLPTSSS